MVALVAMVLLLSSSWRRCPCRNGIIVINNAQASLPSLWWCCCPCCNGIVNINAMALLPMMCRHLYHCLDCNCHTHDNGVIAVVYVLASFPLLSWHHCPRNNGIVTLDLQQCCCPCCYGVVASLKLVSSLLLQWCHCHH